MNTIMQGGAGRPFDFNAWLSAAARRNRLARREGFHFCTCSGIGQLQGVIDGLRQYGAFLVADDVCTGETMQAGGAWFQRRTYTAFVLLRHDFGDEPGRRAALSTCRELLRQLQSRLLRDARRLFDGLSALRVERMPVTETGEYFVAGCSGLYFMLAVDEPVDLSYDDDEWEEE